MKNQNNEWIDIVNDIENDDYGIFIDNQKANLNLGRIQKIKFDYINWRGTKTIKNKETGEIKEVTYIEFDKKISGTLLQTFQKEIKKFLNKNISISDAFFKILRLFQKSGFEKVIREEIYGIIGELLFIIKGKEILNINFQDYIRKIDEALYDFKINDKFLEVKASTKSKNDFKISLNQLNEISNKEIIISKFKCIESETTIIDLFNKVEELTGSLCDIYKEKKAKYIGINERIDIDIISKYCINLEKSNCYIFNNEKLPIIKIEKEGALKEMEILIDATDSNIFPLSNLKINQ